MLSGFWSFLLNVFSVLWFKLEYKQVKRGAKHTLSIAACLQCRYEIFQTHFSTLLFLNNPSIHSLFRCLCFVFVFLGEGDGGLDQAESKQSNTGLFLFFLFFGCCNEQDIYICKSLQLPTTSVWLSAQRLSV